MTAESVDITRQPTDPVRKRATTWSYRPRVDVVENPGAYVVHADMPGTSADDIRIAFADGVLSVHGTVTPRHEKPAEFIAHEFGVGDFDCELSVSDAIIAEGITAEYERGVLTIQLPKRDEVKPRRIAVKEVHRE